MKTMKRIAAWMLILCLTLSLGAAALADTYREGMSGSEIKAIKQRMLELGYYHGEISNNQFNNTMTERVKQLQKNNGLKQTGVVDDALYALIFSDAVIKADGNPVNPAAVQPAAEPVTEQPAAQPAAQQPAANTVLFREGDAGDEVMKIKARMYEMGYYNTMPTVNSFNATMVERVKQLQAMNGLAPTGEIDQATYDVIFSQESAGLNGLPAGTIREGDSGEKVRALRHRMFELAYFDSDGGSEFTSTMTERVKLIQQMNGFAETGVVTPDLYDYIMSDACTQCGVHINPNYNAANRFNYKLDGEKQFSLSSSGNVIIFIVDYFANNWLDGTLKSYPHMLDSFKDFTYYSNCDPRYIGTYPSITHMLTGNAFDPSLLVGEYFEQSWNSDSANYIFNTIHDKGYLFRYFYYTSISDGATSWAMDKIDNLVDVQADPTHEFTPIYSFTDFMDELEARGSLTVDQTEKKYIHMIHLRGAHAPYSADVNGHYNTSVGRNENIAGYMHMVATYIEDMKAQGLYDDATIIVTADHGDKGTNMQVVYWIKQPGEHHDSIPVTAAPISHTDFPGTLMKVIGADYPYGTSIFDWKDGDSRTRSCSVVDRDTSLYSLVTSFSDLEMGAHNMWKTYTYTGDGQELMRVQKRGTYTHEHLAQSFN